jgi:HEAT repeat protein
MPEQTGRAAGGFSGERQPIILAASAPCRPLFHREQTMTIEELCDTPSWSWPDDAADTLLASIRDPTADPTLRREAALLAGEVTVMNEAIARALLDVIRSPDEDGELRARAAIALGPTLESMDDDLEWEDPDEFLVPEAVFDEVLEALHSIFRDPATPKTVRRRVLEASVRASAPWHEGAVRAAYHDADPEWKATGVFAMAYLPGFDAAIVEALEAEEPEVRREAVRAAGRRGLGAAWPHVLPLLGGEHGDREMLLAAIEAAPGIHPAGAIPALEALQESDDEEIAGAADDAISDARAFMAFEDEEDEDDERW